MRHETRERTSVCEGREQINENKLALLRDNNGHILSKSGGIFSEMWMILKRFTFPSTI